MTDTHAADDHATPLTPAERDDLIHHSPWRA
jgi:hypothetical protein